MRKVIISAGGTGGHILPALAIAKAMQEKGWEVVYIGNSVGMEEGLARSAGFRFLPIQVQKLYRKFTWEHIRFPFMLYNSYKRSQQYILSEKPDAFIGCGGFVSGPVGLAAKKLRIPIYLQEQNSYPGITTKYLAKSARKVFTAYDNAKNYLGKATLVKCGNPTGISNQNTETLNMEKFGLSKVNKKLLVLGGSQGSVVINKAIESILDELQKRNIDIIWQTGKHNFLELKQKYGDRKGIFMFAFTNIMNEMYNTADFAVCRAGALTLSELQIKKIPAILIPLPTAAENHQYYNAEELTQKGMAVMLEQKFLTPGTFLKAIDGLLENLRNYKKSFPETNYNVAGIIAETISKDFGV